MLRGALEVTFATALPILPEHVSVALVSVWTIHSEHTAIYCDSEIETFEKLRDFFWKIWLFFGKFGFFGGIELTKYKSDFKSALSVE